MLTVFADFAKVATVLRIHDILVWIRVSMTLTDGSGSCYFRHWPSRRQQKIIFPLKSFFCLLLFEGKFTSFFLLFLLYDNRIWIRIQIHTDPDPGGPKHTDPTTDLDPQYWAASLNLHGLGRQWAPPPCHLSVKFGIIQSCMPLKEMLIFVNVPDCICFGQCCGSMTFWCGSGSGDPCLWLMDLDLDPSIFIIDLQDTNKKRV